MVVDQLRRLGPRHQHGTDHEIGLPHGLLHGVPVRRDGPQPPLELVIDLPQPIHVGVQHLDVGPHPDGHGGGVQPGNAPTDHHDPSGMHPRHATGQHTAPTGGLHQCERTHLRREPPRDLGHRSQQRQRPTGRLHGLVGDPGGAGFQERGGQRPVSSQVQVGEQHEIPPEPRVLLGNRLLDLEHEFTLAPHVISSSQHLGTGSEVLLVRNRRTNPGPGLDEHGVPVTGQLVHAGRCQRHPVLVVLDLGGNSDLHRLGPFSRPGYHVAARSTQCHHAPTTIQWHPGCAERTTLDRSRLVTAANGVDHSID